MKNVALFININKKNNFYQILGELLFSQKRWIVTLIYAMCLYIAICKITTYINSIFLQQICVIALMIITIIISEFWFPKTLAKHYKSYPKIMKTFDAGFEGLIYIRTKESLQNAGLYTEEFLTHVVTELDIILHPSNTVAHKTMWNFMAIAATLISSLIASLTCNSIFKILTITLILLIVAVYALSVTLGNNKFKKLRRLACQLLNELQIDSELKKPSKSKARNKS